MVTENFTRNDFLGMAEIIGKFGSADQLCTAMLYSQITPRHHLHWTSDLLLPRLLSGQVELKTEEARA